MKKIMIASLGLSLLSGTAVFAQNTAGSTDTSTKMTKKTKKSKKSKGSDGGMTGSTTSTSTSK